MSHDIESVSQPYHFIIESFQIVSIGVAPGLAFIVSAPERVRIIQIMDRCDDFIERIFLQMRGYLVSFAFLYANFNALENVEVLRAFGIDLINFCISCLYVEHF